MLDYLHLPKQQNGNIDYFPGISNTDGGSWIAWEKPKGTHMIRITCIAGGGGGGSGFNANPGCGGGGGGSSAVSIVTIPAYVLPDILYVSSGVGGNGGVAPSVNTATLGSDGIRSYVCIAQDTGAIYCVCFADSGKAGTTAATASTGGTAGSAGATAAIGNMLLASYGIRNFIAGQAGRAGSIDTASSGGTNTYPTTGLLLSGGAGGSGSTNSFGGVIGTPSQTVYTIFTTPSGGANSANNTNSSGVEIYQPLLSCGGSSASGSNGGGAGAGGFGSGGAGSRAQSSFPGGKGGNGLVIIHSW
jgi:hypothetical protein